MCGAHGVTRPTGKQAETVKTGPRLIMRITLINQTFYPDVVSSGQHLADLALRLAERGHEVTVVTRSRSYDHS